MAGPYCGLILADLGADVIKIENPAASGAEPRGGHPYLNGESYAFMMVNRNKRSFTVNLKDPRGREIFYRLVKSADALVQNFRPGVTKRLGSDYETLSRVNPGLVYASISGFGEGSPYADRGGVDLITQGMSGLMSITGEPDRPPVKCGVPVCDVGTGMYTALAILAALHHRARTGEGQHVDTCLMDTPISWMAWEAALYWTTGEPPGPLGSGHRLSVPYQAFHCADDVYITIGGTGGRHWQSFCEILKIPEVAQDDRYDTGQKRMERRTELTEVLQRAFDHFSSEYLLEQFTAAGIPCGPVTTVDHILDREEHVKARGMVVEVEHPTVGKVKHLGPPMHLSKTPAGVHRPSPLLGEHTAEIMRDLGWTDPEIEDLRRDKVV
jgi:formyl-CoA transferase